MLYGLQSALASSIHLQPRHFIIHKACVLTVYFAHNCVDFIKECVASQTLSPRSKPVWVHIVAPTHLWCGLIGQFLPQQ